MRRKQTGALIMAGLFLIGLFFVQADVRAGEEKKKDSEKEELSAKKILDYVDDLYRGESSKSKMTMHIKTKHWERSLTMRAWSKGEEKTLVKVLKPLKERGTATLKVGDEMYNYLPKTDRTIKLTSAMMMSSWMGSHFTNDDLVKESRMSEDYNSEITFVGEREGKQIIEITSTPKENAAVVWGKLISIIRKDDWQPLKIEYYDEEGEKERTLTFSEHKKISDRLLPTVMKMVPEDEANEYTKITYENIEFGVDLSDSFFSLNQLKR